MENYDLISQALRALFLIVLPILAVATIAGVLVGAFQTATNIQETALNYLAKLIAILVGLYYFSAGAIELIRELAISAWQ